MKPHDSGQNSRIADVLTVISVLAGLFLVLYVLPYVSIVLLTAFAGVLLAILLDGVAGFIAQHTPLSRTASLVHVLVFGAIAFGIVALLLGPRVVSQLTGLAEQVPRAAERIRNYLSGRQWGQQLLGALPTTGRLAELITPALLQFMGALSTLVGAVSGVVLVVVVGLFVAFRPVPYREGLVHLVPPHHRHRFRTVLGIAGNALRRWLLARIISMAIIGALTGLGLTIAGVPLALALGLLAGILEFIPYLGPTMASIPIVLVAFASDPPKALWALLVFLIVQFLESNLVTPLVEQTTTTVRAGLLIVVQVLLGSLVGLVGVLLASPLTVLTIVLVEMLYVEDVLGDQVKVPGEP